MNLKLINNFLLLSLIFILISCNQISIIEKKNSNLIVYDEIFEFKQSIDIVNSIYIQNDYNDFFQPLSFNALNLENDFKKIKTINTYESKNNINPLISIIKDNQIININKKSEINFINLDNYKTYKKINLDLDLNSDYSYPTSIAYFDDKYFISYIDGRVYRFDLDGKIIWAKYFEDIIKTPLKIYNDNIIVLLSDRIISLNSDSGELKWEFIYNAGNLLKSLGGDIVTLNHLIFFILPNGQIGEIDTVLGDKNNSLISKVITNSNIRGSSNKLHIYKNFLSIFDQNKFLTTINVQNDTFLLNNNEILNVNSFKFFNNTILVHTKDNFLKAYNILNNKIFWQNDLLSLVKPNDKIINIFYSNEDIVVIFKSGIMMTLDSSRGLNKSFNN